ncbi:MAG TPA: DUF1003 domain-containing protein [Thermoanaerobaculia bacterium]|nr:DUF1003 domain-containing protein [Thermoanaerobaculia bacterium]
MTCPPEILRQVALFSLLDDDELAVLAGQVEVETFAARRRIYKIGDPSEAAYVMVSGSVRVTTVDEDQQEVLVDEPIQGDLFGFASMINSRPHQTSAIATEETVCIRFDRHDITVLLEKKPLAGMDMLAVLGRQFHGAQQLVRLRAARNPNEIIEEKETRPEKIADGVAAFGGSWTFIIAFAVVLVVYTAVNVALRGHAWDPYPFILLNLFLSMLAAIQAPVIMMSQNRQDKKDRVRSEMDFEVNRRAEAEIQGLSRSLRHLGDRIEDMEALLHVRS